MHYECPQIYLTLGNLLCQLADAMSQITAQTYLLKIYITCYFYFYRRKVQIGCMWLACLCSMSETLGVRPQRPGAESSEDLVYHLY